MDIQFTTKGNKNREVLKPSSMDNKRDVFASGICKTICRDVAAKHPAYIKNVYKPPTHTSQLSEGLKVFNFNKSIATIDMSGVMLYCHKSGYPM
jgi:hypothetical protein